jgi:hypothetical protein
MLYGWFASYECGDIKVGSNMLCACVLRNLTEHMYQRNIQTESLSIYRSYGVTLFIASILAGKYQTRFSRSLTIKIGVFLHAVACGCFIGLDYCDDKYVKSAS